MKAIILAAGRGTRMGTYGADLPKGMLSFGGRSLLRRQIDALRQSGVEDIYIVTGYRNACIDFDDVEYFHNPEYATTNMLESLMQARAILHGDCLVTYADILFSPSLVTQVEGADGDIVVAADNAWKTYWKIRYGTTEQDLESFTVGPNGNITELGKPVASSEGLDHRYIGMIRFSPKGIQNILSVYDKKQADNSAWLQSGKPFELGYMTDLLDEAIRSGHKVLPSVSQHGWLEFDTAEDYEVMCRLMDAGTIKDLIDLGENGPNHE
jgi:L-glutamine-phosphate cytidylyltransferase